MYHCYVLFYVDGVLCISYDPFHITKFIQANFKLKLDNIEEPGMYIGIELSNMTNVDGQELGYFF